MLQIHKTTTIQMIFQGDPLTNIKSNKNLKYNQHNKSLSMSFKSLFMAVYVCLKTEFSKLLRLLLKNVLLKNHNRK